MKFVKNKKQLWRHYSLQSLASIAILQTTWFASPKSWIDALPSYAPAVMIGLTFVFLAFGIIGKFVDQELPGDKAAE